MIYEPKTIDLSVLAEHFITIDGCPKEQLLAELVEYQKEPDFLVLIDEEEGNINGFMIAYGIHDNLWINQIWRQNDSKLSNGLEAMRMAREWGKERGMISIMGETKRDEVGALKRYGFEEFSVNIKAKI